MSTTVAPARPRLTRVAERVPDWAVALGAVAVTVGIAVIPQVQGTFFYYVGDNPESFVPLWHHLGGELRAGQWPTMNPDGWMGGNYAGEAAYTLWNPVSVANYVLVSYFTNLSLAAFVVMVEFLGLLALAVYLLAREYGASRAPSFLVAVALPLSGFTLWYEASGWPAGLMAFTWVAHFWWAARKHARGRLTPVVPFVLGVLAMTTGNPYAAVGLVIVLAAIAVELLVQRRPVPLAHLVLMGACVGASAALVFLPLLSTTGVTVRPSTNEILNDTFLVPDLGDLAAASSPTYLPSISNWNGARLESLPSTYFAFFVLPLLPWLRWSSLRGRLTGLTSLAVVGGVYAVTTLGPSNLWMFRWPLRLIEYLYLALAVLFAVVLSAGLARDRVRRRIAWSVAIVAVGTYLAWAVRPEYWRLHLYGALLVLGVLGVGLLAARRVGLGAFTAVLVAGTAAVVLLQTTVFPQIPPGGTPVYPPYDISEMEGGAQTYEGTVLQLATQAGVTTDVQADGRLLFGNLPVALDLDSINRYTGIGFAEFSEALCMDYRGVVCPEAYERLWRPVGDGIDVPLVDALRVETLVLQRSLLPEETDGQGRPGWRVAERDDVREVWVREDPLPYDDRVAWVSEGAEVEPVSSAAGREVVRVSAPPEGARVLFSRLAWPGHEATIDGEAVEVVDGPAGLLEVEVPGGDHELVVTFTSPGVRLGLAALAGAALVVLAHSVVWGLLRRRDRARETAPPPAEVVGGEGPEPEAERIGAGRPGV